ncbi:MAG TPA: hypothetical protein VNE62_13085, partial [Actinomycetota bacterium]|nr:hypothetical protein [Actinomycetota bacterium]
MSLDRPKAATRATLLAVTVLTAGVAFAPPAAAASADLSLEKTCTNATADRGTGFAGPEPDEEVYVAPGDLVECTVVVTNNGPDDATNVLMADRIDGSARIEGEPVE